MDSGTTWGAAPYPVLVADASGDVVEVNAAAAALFPSAVPGAWLRCVVPAWIADAHARTGSPAVETGDAASGSPSSPVHGRVGDRTFEAHPTRTDDGDVTWWLVDDTDRRLAEDALASERKRTAFLADASSALLSSLNVERCMEVTARLAAEHLADAAVIVAPPRGRKVPLTYCGPDGDVVHRQVRADVEQLPGLSDALRGVQPVRSRRIDPAAVPEWAVPDRFTDPVRSVIVTPLPGHGVPAGALVLLRSGRQPAVTESEEIFARLFASRAGAAMSAARMYAEQAAVTTTLMRDLLPPRLHSVHGVEFAGKYLPSGQADRVGGDFYDVHPGTDEGQESLVVLGDVCGKGLDAAVLTGKVRNTVQALLPLAEDHQRLLGLLNGALMNSHHTRFVTLALASVVRSGRTVRLRVTSAGHPAPLIVRADGLVETVETRGTLVGAFWDITSTTAHVELAPGETCLFFTDGITEGRGGPHGNELFGAPRLESALARCAGLPAEAVVEHIQTLAAQWVGRGGHDDMATVAVTAPHHAHLSAVNGHTRGRYTA
ncbi:SpoIIE family protein phosphatase [Streptomyces sp. NBC_01571]|uniref:PP2C family protein-serine/threonine phosphatase n=1 Tax=Streptomyces sp. NBC_01571 TaxID=2975883 RepID=UPI00224CA87E|nr:GAF domain-containing SpoIIE family protein phosphatase [Streptomyces sp. NBC_01571]MCX4580143.1 SpoIIE family protein phosphatase [Streptomyces sp. NBC_01571]